MTHYECVTFDGWEEHSPGSFSRPYGAKTMYVVHDTEHPLNWIYGISEDPPNTGAFIVQGRCSSKQEAMAACHFACKS